MDPHQANLQPSLLLLRSRLRFNPTPTFLGVTFDCTLSFSKPVSSLKARCFPLLKALRCISASSWGPSKESLSILYKSFLRSLLTYASPGWFPFQSVTNLTKSKRLHRGASRAITGCLSSSPIPLLPTKTSLPPLRVTLTDFTVLSYERGLRLPTSFPISGLARLGVKSKLCRSSWRAFASTHPLMLPSTCSREALLACSPCPPWILPSFTVDSTPCSRSDPLSLAKLRLLPILTLSPSWSGELDRRLCSFSFWKGRLRRSFGRPSMLKLFRWSLRHSARSLLFSAAPTSLPFLFSSCLTLVLSSPPYPLLHLSFYLKLCGRSERNCLYSPVLLGYYGSPDTRFSRGTTRLMSWPDGERYLRPPQSLVVSRIHSCLILDWRHTVSSKYFDTQVPSISTEELVHPRHARCVVSHLRCNGHGLLLSSYLSRIGRTENPSCSACGHSSQDTSHLILHCPATYSLRRWLFGDSLSLYDLWPRPWGVARLLGLHGHPPCPHPWEGVG